MIDRLYFKMNSFHYMDEFHSWLQEKDLDPEILSEKDLETLIYKFDKALGLKWIKSQKNTPLYSNDFDIFKIENKSKFFLTSLKYELFDFIQFVSEEDFLNE